MEWQTSNKVQKEQNRVGSHILHSKMQEVKLDKLSLLDVWKQGFLGINSFNYPYNYTRQVHLNEEVDVLGCYETRELVFKEFPIRKTVAPNPNVQKKSFMKNQD